jgi:hypothetical protein
MKFAKLLLVVVLLATAALAGTPGTELFIPAGAKASGAGGTDWRSDLRIFNPNSSAVDVTIYYLPRAIFAGDADSQVVHVEAMQVQMFENILVNLFGKTTNTAGAFRLTCSLPILAESRIWTPGTTGSYGQRIPGVPKGQSVDAGSNSDLIYVDNTSAFRTNGGFVDTTGSGSTLTVTAYASDGTVAGTPMNVTLGAYEPKQLDGILAQLGVAGSSQNYRVNVLVNTGSVIPYASQVDNASGDPIYIDGAVAKSGGGPAGCMTSGAYYGYSQFTTDPDYDWLDTPFAPTLVDGVLEGFAILGTNHLGVNYVWPIVWTDVYFDPPLDLPLEANVPFSTEFQITFTYVGMPDNCVTTTYTVAGTWDGCSKISAGTIDFLFKVSADPGCKELKDAQGKFAFAWEAGIDPAMAPVSAVKPHPAKRSAKYRVR